MDVTVGDRITPREIEMSFPSLFGNTATTLKSYNLETLLAEKLNAILVMGVANTRMKDFFDVHSIWQMLANEISVETLSIAISETANFRNNAAVLNEASEILRSIKDSEILAEYWQRYQKTFSVANRYSFAEVCASIEAIVKQALSTY